MGPSRSALQPEEIISKGDPECHVCTINKSAHMNKSANLFNDPRIMIFSKKSLLSLFV